jgi:hypothetical protein
MVRLKGLGQLKNRMNSSGVEPATFQLVAQCLNKLRYCVFKSLSIIGRWPVNINTLVPKIEVRQISVETQNGVFLENGSNDFALISVSYEDNLPK